MACLPDGEKTDDTFSRFDRIPACDGRKGRRTDRQTYFHNIIRAMHTRQPILMQIGTSVVHGVGSKGMKRSTLEVTRSKVKATRGRRQILGPGGGIILDFVSVE